MDWVFSVCEVVCSSVAVFLDGRSVVVCACVESFMDSAVVDCICIVVDGGAAVGVGCCVVELISVAVDGSVLIG